MWRDVLRSMGYEAIRGCQNAGRGAGGQEAPDVISNLPFHFEVKFVEKLNIRDAVTQAVGDCPEGKIPAVAHKKKRDEWLVTVRADDFFKILRGESPTTQRNQQKEKHLVSNK